MTEAESISRAERIVALFLTKESGSYVLMVIEVARGLREVAVECGWQKELVAELLRQIKEARAI